MPNGLDTLNKPSDPIMLLNETVQEDLSQTQNMLLNQPQQQDLTQPQNMLLNQPQQQDLTQPQNMLLNQPQQQDFTQPQQVSEASTQQVLSPQSNITDFLSNQQQSNKEYESPEEMQEREKALSVSFAELLQQNQGPVSSRPKISKKLKPGDQAPELLAWQKEQDKKAEELRLQQEKEKFEEESYVRKMRADEEAAEREDMRKHSANKQTQQIRQEKEEDKEDVQNKALQKLAKTQFEQGIESKPGCCERRRRRNKIAEGKDKLDCERGITERSLGLSDEIRTYQSADQLRQQEAEAQIEPIAQERRKSEEKSKQPVNKGLTEQEMAMSKLSAWMPISRSYELKSANPAARAVVLKTYVDRAVSYNITPEMICSIALQKEYANLRDLTTNVPILSKLLQDDPLATALIDGEKLDLFRSVEKMVPDLQQGLESGLRLNGLQKNGLAAYYDKNTDSEVEADKRKTSTEWLKSHYQLHLNAESYRDKVVSHQEGTGAEWDKYIRYVTQTGAVPNSPVIMHRHSLDSASSTMSMVQGQYDSERANTQGQLEKIAEFSQIHDNEQQNAIKMLVPKSATKEELAQHVEKFNTENIKETMQDYAKEILQLELPKTGLVCYENSTGDNLQNMLLLRDKLNACSSLATANEKTLEGMRANWLKLLKSARAAANNIDQTIEFLKDLYSTSTVEQKKDTAERVSKTMTKYKAFWTLHESERTRAKNNNLI